MRDRKKKVALEPEPATRALEGFSTHKAPDPRRCELDPEASVFNSLVSVYRYRVTVERIEEPREVILARMFDLYCTTDNHHRRTALVIEATTRFGVDLREMRAAVKQ